MSVLRPELARIVEELVEGTPEGGSLTLDAFGEAIGAREIRQDEIDAMLSAIERRGRRVASPEGGRGELHLKTVIATARALRAELGRPPRAEEIAERAGIPRADVQHALALARVMQR
jgi:hypothetical protein